MISFLYRIMQAGHGIRRNTRFWRGPVTYDHHLNSVVKGGRYSFRVLYGAVCWEGISVQVWRVLSADPAPQATTMTRIATKFNTGPYVMP